MKKIFACSLILAASLAAPMFAQGEAGRSEVGVSALGVFPQGSGGDGVHQQGSFSGGVMADYRYYFTKHMGIEVDYAYTRDTQQFRPLNGLGVSGVQSDMHEASASYVVRMAPRGRLTPFVSAGAGALIFNPSYSTTSVVPNEQTRAAFVYGGGIDYELTHHLLFRAQYRGFVFKAPDFDTGVGSNSVTHMVEPAGGFVWKF